MSAIPFRLGDNYPITGLPTGRITCIICDVRRMRYCLSGIASLSERQTAATGGLRDSIIAADPLSHLLASLKRDGLAVSPDRSGGAGDR